MKLLISLFVLFLAEAFLFSQGTVTFLNDTVTLSSPPDRFIRFCASGSWNNLPAYGTNLQVQLYYGASTASEGSLIALTAGPARLRVSTSTAVGTWTVGGTRTFSGVDVGATLKLQVRVWDINYGATYEAALANPNGPGLFGKSQAFLYTVPAISADPADFTMKNFRGLYIAYADLPGPGVPLACDYCCWPNTCALPKNQSVLAGQNATLTVVVGSCPAALIYIWRFNGIDFFVSSSSIPTSTRIYTNTLTITNVQLAQAGAYSVIVTNSYGALTSPPAILTVIQPQLAARPLSSSAVQIAWSTSLNAYVLESVAGFGSSWNQVTNGIGVQGNEFIFNEPASSAQKFFRLRKP